MNYIARAKNSAQKKLIRKKFYHSCFILRSNQNDILKNLSLIW